jgi:hypothetical protein
MQRVSQKEQLARLTAELEAANKKLAAAKEFLYAVNNGDWHMTEAETHDPCRICELCDKFGKVLFPADALAAIQAEGGK